MTSMSRYRLRQLIYWGTEQIPPRLEQMNTSAELQPDGLLLSSYRPDGGYGTLLISYDDLSSLMAFVRDHADRTLAIWQKQVNCPGCQSMYCQIERRGYPTHCMHEWRCGNCGENFTTNYQGYREGEPEPGQTEEAEAISEDLGDLEEHPF